MPKRIPTLGYPSRTDAVLALRRDGVEPAEIARRIGISPGTVVALECSGARARRRLGPLGHDALLPPELRDALAAHAARRGISANALTRMIVETVVRAELIDAVLDDSPRRRGNG